MSEELRLTRVTYENGRPAGQRFFMCRHVGASPERALADVAASHDLDLKFQERHGVRWLSYFLDSQAGRSFCLAQAPSREAIETCHLEAHGQMLPYRIIEVDWEMVQAFLGEIAEPGPGQEWHSTALRTIMAARVVNAASLAVRAGDTAALELLQRVRDMMLAAVRERHGSHVRVEVDSLLASFSSASRAVECAFAVQRRLSELNATAPAAVDLRIGLNAGEPVAQTGELF
ncbi:MAG TPA: nickel-binding protein, partial [Dehalococcoidia bacterium]|nr:nickel-binding protein [Dehalococcoidia bacterium]